MFSIRANAKINLGLKIVGKRPDGYHLLSTIFQEVDFGDDLYLEESLTADFNMETDDPGLPTDGRNLCRKAYHKMAEEFPDLPGVKMELRKRIPMGAGLGGGSSDAAATLLGLIKMFRLPVDDSALLNLAVEIGTDVPFFLYGGMALGEGIGEQLTVIHLNWSHYIVIVIPDIHISTAWAFKNLNYDLTSNAQQNKFRRFFDIGELKWQIKNDFEPLIIKRYSEIGEIKERLIHLQAELVSLSGSGSAVFGTFPEKAAAQKAQEMLSKEYRCVLTTPVMRNRPRNESFRNTE